MGEGRSRMMTLGQQALTCSLQAPSPALDGAAGLTPPLRARRAGSWWSSVREGERDSPGWGGPRTQGARARTLLEACHGSKKPFLSTPSEDLVAWYTEV